MEQFIEQLREKSNAQAQVVHDHFEEKCKEAGVRGAGLPAPPRPHLTPPGPSASTSGCMETLRRAPARASFAAATKWRLTSPCWAPTATTAPSIGMCAPLRALSCTSLPSHAREGRLTHPPRGPDRSALVRRPQHVARQHRRLRGAPRELRRAAREAPASRDDALAERGRVGRRRPRAAGPSAARLWARKARGGLGRGRAGPRAGGRKYIYVISGIRTRTPSRRLRPCFPPNA